MLPSSISLISLACRLIFFRFSQFFPQKDGQNRVFSEGAFGSGLFFCVPLPGGSSNFYSIDLIYIPFQGKLVHSGRFSHFNLFRYKKRFSKIFNFFFKKSTFFKPREKRGFRRGFSRFSGRFRSRLRSRLGWWFSPVCKIC